METKLDAILSILFEFMMLEIVRLSYTKLRITASFSFGIVDLGEFFIELILKILLIDDRYQLPTLN